MAVPGVANSSGTTNAIANALILNGTGIGGASGALQNTSPFTNYLTGGITLAGNTTIFTGGGGGNILESSTITDNGAGFNLTKTGVSTLILAGATNFGGGLTITAGTLEIGDGGNTGSVQGNILDNGSLVFNRTDSAFYYPGSISGAGSVTQGASTGTLVLTGANTYTGATNVNSGGTLNVAPGALAGSTSINVGTSVTSQLNFYAGGSGATIDLAAGASLNLGGTSSVGRLGFLVGDLNDYDSVGFVSGGSVSVGADGAQIFISTLPGFGAGTYTLINAPGGITGGPITLAPGVAASLATGYKEVLATGGTTVTLTVSAAPSGNFYYTGTAGNSSWYANVSAGAPSNWSTNPAGGSDAGFTPGVLDTVNFSASSITGNPAITTTLDQNFSIAGLVVNNSSTGAVTINPGSFNGTLTLGAGGITVQSGGPASTTINANMALGVSQPWTVNSGSTLAVNGNVSGSGFSITNAGGGVLSLSGFNTFTGGLIVNGGTLLINNGGSTTTNSAIGVTGALTLATGVTIDNTSGVSQAVLTNNTQNWTATGGAFALTFTGSNSLSMGTGAVTPTTGTAITITTNGATLAEGGIIAGGASSITKLGTGALTLSGANTYSSGFTLNNGTVRLAPMMNRREQCRTRAVFSISGPTIMPGVSDSDSTGMS